MFTPEALNTRYLELIAKRDATDAAIAPLLAQMEQASIEVMTAQAKASELAEQIANKRGGGAWFDLKREIATITRALGGKLPTATS